MKINMWRHPIMLSSFFVSCLFGGTAFSQMPVPYPNEAHQLDGKKIKCFIREKTMQGTPEKVFSFMDDIRNTGKHMTKNNAQMMGTKLELRWLTDHHTGLGTQYQWAGKVLGMKMDFSVEVTKWIEDEEKIWGTFGEAEMIVIDWFRMFLFLVPANDGSTKVELGILYTKPKGNLYAFLLGRRYAVWCVKSMLKDTKKHFKHGDAPLKQ